MSTTWTVLGIAAVLGGPVLLALVMWVSGRYEIPKVATAAAILLVGAAGLALYAFGSAFDGRSWGDTRWSVGWGISIVFCLIWRLWRD
jgi:hypothetical protein